MGIIEALTPKRVEEIKPELFIQETLSGKYRKIEPIAWNGKIRWKQQLSTIISFRFFLTIGIVLFLVWAYNHDVKELIEFHNEVVNDTFGFCTEYMAKMTREPCTYERSIRGECFYNKTELEEAIGNVTFS